MKNVHIAIAVAVAALFALPAGAALIGAPSITTADGQSGTTLHCADYNVAYNVALVQVEGFAVQGGTNFLATQTGGNGIYVDWYTANGSWITWSEGSSDVSGVVPSSAATATVCVGLIGSFYPDVPAVGASWTYDDGL